MKICVFVYGEYREFNYAVQSWWFLKEYDCDVYFSTWDKSVQMYPKYGICIDEAITEDDILIRIPNANVSISSIKDYETEFPNSSEKVLFHWRKCLNMVNNKEYDYLMLTRTDNVFVPLCSNECFGEVIKNIKNNMIYGTSKLITDHLNNPHVNDVFFIGEFKTMINFINKLPYKFNILNDGGSLHTNLARYILDMNLTLESIENYIGIRVVRPTIRAIKIDESTPQICYDKSNEWQEIKLGL